MSVNKFLEVHDGCQFVITQGARKGEFCGKTLPKQVDSEYCYAHVRRAEEDKQHMEQFTEYRAKKIEEEAKTRYDMSFSFRSDEKIATFMLESFMKDFLKEIKAQPGKVNFHISINVKD